MGLITQVLRYLPEIREKTFDIKPEAKYNSGVNVKFFREFSMLNKCLFFMLFGFLSLSVLLTGCEGRLAAVKEDYHHFFLTDSERFKALPESMKREAEFIISEIEGPLKAEIRAYFYYNIMKIGPLVYSSREFAESQLKAAEELPEQIAKLLKHQLIEHLNELQREFETYGQRQIAELPKLDEDFRKFLAYRKVEVDRFVNAVERYHDVNVALVNNLSVDIQSFAAWQVENAKGMGTATDKYIARISADYDAMMSSGGRMFRFNLTVKPEEVKKTLMRFARHNSEEMVTELKKAPGKFFRHQLDVSDMAKDMHAFAEYHVGKTTHLMRSVEDFFALNVYRTTMLDKEVRKFFDWRSRQWAAMRRELDRYISHNVENFSAFKKAPLKYLEHQKEEWDILMKTIPEYFKYNASKTEHLNAALRRFFSFNTTGYSANTH